MAARQSGVRNVEQLALRSPLNETFLLWVIAFCTATDWTYFPPQVRIRTIVSCVHAGPSTVRVTITF